MNSPSSTPTRTAGAHSLLFPLHASFDSSCCLFLNGVPVPAQPSPVPDSCPCCCWSCCRPSHSPSSSPLPSRLTLSSVSPSLLRTPYFGQLLSPGIDPRRTCEKPQQRLSPLASPPALNLTPPPPRVTHPFTSIHAQLLSTAPSLETPPATTVSQPLQLGLHPPQYLPTLLLPKVLLPSLRGHQAHAPAPAAACRKRSC